MTKGGDGGCHSMFMWDDKRRGWGTSEHADMGKEKAGIGDAIVYADVG